ncbi:hypothetical protein EJB05_49216, partial [Eragrostis curvula]
FSEQLAVVVCGSSPSLLSLTPQNAPSLRLRFPSSRPSLEYLNCMYASKSIGRYSRGCAPSISSSSGCTMVLPAAGRAIKTAKNLSRPLGVLTRCQHAGTLPKTYHEKLAGDDGAGVALGRHGDPPAVSGLHLQAFDFVLHQHGQEGGVVVGFQGQAAVRLRRVWPRGVVRQPDHVVHGGVGRRGHVLRQVKALQDHPYHCASQTLHLPRRRRHGLAARNTWLLSLPTCMP